ncbi:MAG: haloacid dehalogenase type II [Pseudomonadota bacterium]
MVGALIFDVFGTLVDWRTGVADAVRAAYAAKGREVDAPAFADAWRAEYDPAMARIRTGDRGYVPLDDLHLENLDRVLAARGEAALFSGEERAVLNRGWERLPPWPEVVGALTTLRQSHIIAPCSNGSIALMTRLARFGGLPWDCILGAEIARDYKPKAEVYLACCRALRLAPAEVMMVAAHPSDLAAARAAGLRTGYFPRPLEHGPGAVGEPGEETGWDIVAADLADFAAQLAARS